ncbi:uncharacterized protein LOC107872192 isoform X2 [Capsicum annuum]|uniref:uncharacterized protein LOC107872192 isoform X2 n=1 Tax=Capsicum annuum TaxID=4072 RepID=UPI0007BEACFD|nr:uncharacterized protein LOC107872192 isoform X2 [Capsicum annuum]
MVILRGLKSAGVSEVVSRDLSRTPDSAKPLTYDNDRFIGKKAPPNRFRNVMSPIEEEEIGEQMTVSPAMEAGSQPIELFAAPHASSSLISETLFIGRSSSSLDSEKINPACRSSNSYGSPNSIVIHYEEDLRANVEEVFDPDAAQYDSATSPDKPAGYIVLDFRRKMISMIGMGHRAELYVARVAKCLVAINGRERVNVDNLKKAIIESIGAVSAGLDLGKEEPLTQFLNALCKCLCQA